MNVIVFLRGSDFLSYKSHESHGFDNGNSTDRSEMLIEPMTFVTFVTRKVRIPFKKHDFHAFHDF